MSTNKNHTPSLSRVTPKQFNMMNSNNFEQGIRCMMTPKKSKIFNGYEPMEIETNLKEYPEIQQNITKND